MSPIGVFDSGIGGFSVLRTLLKLLPFENFLYFADTAFAPYGNRSAAEIEERSNKIIAWMYQKNVKLVVAACHTSSAVLLQSQMYQLPIITMMNSTLQAVMSCNFSQGLGILATPLSVARATFANALKAKEFSAPIHSIGCADFVTLIENDEKDALAYKAKEYLEIFQLNPVDYILLGCTHYPFMKNILSKYTSIPFIDPSLNVASDVKNFLKENDLFSQLKCAKVQIYCSGSAHVIKNYLSRDLSLNAKVTGISPIE